MNSDDEKRPQEEAEQALEYATAPTAARSFCTLCGTSWDDDDIYGHMCSGGTPTLGVARVRVGSAAYIRARAQAALKEAESPWFGVWVERAGEPGFWRNHHGTERLETTETEAARIAQALNETSVERTDSVGWMYRAMPIGWRERAERAEAALAEERAKREAAERAEAAYRGNWEDAVARAEAAEARVRELESAIEETLRRATDAVGSDT